MRIWRPTAAPTYPSRPFAEAGTRSLGRLCRGLDARPPTKPPTLIGIPLNRAIQHLSPRFDKIPGNQRLLDYMEEPGRGLMASVRTDLDGLSPRVVYGDSLAHYNCRTTLAGTPATSVAGRTSCVTTAPAATRSRRLSSLRGGSWPRLRSTHLCRW